jgi:hypothetical protein
MDAEPVIAVADQDTRTWYEVFRQRFPVERRSGLMNGCSTNRAPWSPR